jgi:DNA repair protein RecO (recombination protein O)
MKQHTTTAIILKRIEYGEADRILTALTPDVGKITLLAKGVRRSKSKLAGGLELFSITHVTYLQGKSELKTIIGTKLDVHYRAILENMESTMAAYDFMKYMHTFTEEEVDPSYFSLLESGLASLDKREASITTIKTWYMFKLLELSGHGINVDRQLDGSDFKEGARYQFSFDDMSFFTAKSGQYQPEHIKLIRLLSKVSKPELLLKVNNTDALLPSIEQLVQQAIRTYA